MPQRLKGCVLTLDKHVEMPSENLPNLRKSRQRGRSGLRPLPATFVLTPLVMGRMIAAAKTPDLGLKSVKSTKNQQPRR